MRTKNSIGPLFAVLGLVAPSAFGQAQFEWLATHDGLGTGAADTGNDVAVDALGNVFVTSEVRLTSTANDTNVDVIKYSPSGALLWSRRYDMPGSASDQPNDIEVASNGDVCVVGAGSAPDYDLFLLRYDTAGNLLWSLTFGGAPGSGGDFGRALTFDSAGNAVIAGRATDANGLADILVQSYQPNGQLLWDTRVDGSTNGQDHANDVLIDSGGNICVAGALDTLGLRMAAVAKLDSQGQFLWLRELNASYPLTFEDRFQRLALDGQGGVIVIGSTRYEFSFPFITRDNALVARYDGGGTLQWYRTYGGQTYAGGTDAIVDDHGVVNALYHYDFLAVTKATVQRFTLAGQLLSTSHYDGVAHNGASGTGFVRGAAGQLFIGGREGSGIASTADEAFLLQQDSTGAMNWTRQFPGNGFGPMIGRAIAAPGNRIVLCGTTYPPSSSDFDALVMQIDVGDAPQTYCTAKVNSQGCTPSIGFTGVSSAAASSGFTLRTDPVRNNKFGLCIYTLNGPAANPFGGGILCVAGPILRTLPQGSGGNAPPADDCSGAYSIDMNAFAQGALGGNPSPALTVPGTTVHAQHWGRDPGFSAPDNITLSNGLRYIVLP